MTNTKKTYIVKIEGRDSEVYRFKVQENTNGQFGKSFPLELPATYFDGMEMVEVKEYVQKFLNGEVEEPKVTEHDMGDEAFDSDDEENNWLRFEFTPYKLKLFGGVVVVLFGLMIGFVQFGQSNAQEDQVLQLYESLTVDEKINFKEKLMSEIRVEREQVYDVCLATCEAERAVYDNAVNKHKAEVMMLQAEKKGGAIVRTIEDN